MSERYPKPVGNFESWFGALMKQIETACDEYQISDAVEAIRPYVENKWCFPDRLTVAEAAAAKARLRLKSKGKAGLI